MKFKENQHGTSLLIPVEPWLRAQLDIIEHFAQQNVDVSCLSQSTKAISYKPLWRGSTMYISIAPWCCFSQQNLETGHFDSVERMALNQKGSFNITVEVPYIYLGPHKNGENVSLSMDIVQVVFQPKALPIAPFKLKASEKRGRPRNQPIQPRPQHVATN